MIPCLIEPNNTIIKICLEDRICHSTWNSNNLNSRPPQAVILDILESLGKSLQLSYYNQYMIPCLNKPNNIIIQIYSEDLQNLTAKF